MVVLSTLQNINKTEERMKIRLFIKDVAISIGVVVGFIIVIVLLTIYYLVKELMAWCAIITSSQHKRDLLGQLKKVNEPASLCCCFRPFDICPFTRTAECEELISQCRRAGVADWRIRLTALPNY